jgi:hypothetical protein
MDLAFGFLMLLWGLLGRGRTTPEQAPRTKGGVSWGRPELVKTPPWPAVVPAGLPPFPGSGWEFDEPPPQVVQKRAGELVSQLWAKGKGSYKIEQTAGRWIAYQAGLTVGNKHGVIAYRQKRAAALPAARPAPARAPGAPASAPPAARPPAPATGMPPGSVRVTLPGGAVITEPGLGLPTLRYGRGLKPAAPDKDVVLLQQKLGITADGRFGKDTRTAVSNFQAKQVNAQRPGWKLSDIDGVVGPQTWTALFAVRA